MSSAKLTVMHKKFIKILRATISERTKQKILLFDLGRSNNKERITLMQQRPLIKMINQMIGNMPVKKKENSLDKVFYALFRYMHNSIEEKIRQHPKLLQTSRNIWKALRPQLLKNEKRLQPFWSRVAIEGTVPKLSRGFNNKSTSDKDSFDHKVPATNQQNPTKTNKNKNRKVSVRSQVEKFSDIQEQKFYTQEFSSSKTPTEKNDKDEQSEKYNPDLPPLQRCRLSCPLPPQEFFPPEKSEFLANYRAPSLRFALLPAEFLPILKPKEKVESSPNPPDKVEEDTSAKKPKVTTARIDTVDFPDFMPKSSIKHPKNYLNLQIIKSQIYPPENKSAPKMKALLFEPMSLALRYDAVNAPTRIHKDEVLVQVAYSGVCGTDLFITEGKVPCGANPIILGHEISGKVYAVGSGVTHVQPGNDVAINAFTGCCACQYCSRGLFSSCLSEGMNNFIGKSKNGGWAEFVLVKKSQVHKVPPALGLDQAALVQPLSCIINALTRLNLSYGMNILIQGLGLSGCLWASVLHSRGFRKVFVSDKSEKRIKQFEALGLGYSFLPPEDLGQYSADVIVECTGSPGSIEKSLHILKSNGQMCLFGKPNPMTEIRCTPFELVQKEIEVFGKAGNSSCFAEAIHVATSMGYQYLDFEKLGAHTFKLEDYKQAFQMKKTGEIGKIIFEFDS